jgi:hypothetical protein
MSGSLVFFRLEKDCCEAEAEHGCDYGDGLCGSSIGRDYNNIY